MRNLSIAALGLAILAVLASCTTPSTDTLPTERGISLFNGEDLTGWDGDPTIWRVENGVIRGETTADVAPSDNSFLIWDGQSGADFELQLSFRLSSQNNSGIQYRSIRLDGKNDWVVGGYQYELRNSEDMPMVSGYLYDEKGAAGGRRRICMVGEKAIWTDSKVLLASDIINPDAYADLFRLNDWNEAAIVAKGGHILHYLNGQLIMDFTDNSSGALDRGLFALQVHAGEPMWVEFRDIRLTQY